MLFIALALFLSFIVILLPRFGVILTLFLWGTVYQIIPQDIQFIYSGVVLNPSRIMGLILTIALMITTVTRLSSIRWSSSLVLLLLFSVWSAITLLWADNTAEGLSLYIRFLSGFFLYTTVAIVFNTPQKIINLFKWMILGGSITALFAIYDFVLKAGISPSVIYRERGIFDSPGGTATMFLVLISFILATSILIKKSHKFLWIIILLLLSIGIFITLTRATILGLIIMLIYWSYGQYKLTHSLKKSCAWALLPIFIVILGGYIVGLKGIEKRMEDVPIVGKVKLTDPEAGMGRISLWKMNIEKIAKGSILNIFFGSGLSDSQFRIKNGRIIKGEFTHNDFLFLLLDTGLTGLGIYTLWLFMMMRYSRQIFFRSKVPIIKNIGLSSQCLIIGYTTVGMFGLTIFVTSHRWYYMVAMGCLEAIKMHYGREKTNFL